MQLISSDFLYNATDLLYRSYIESCTGIIAGSLVMLRPLCRALSKKFPTSQSQSQSSRSRQPHNKDDWSDPSTNDNERTKNVRARIHEDDVMLGTFGATYPGTRFERLESDNRGDVERMRKDGHVTKQTEIVIESSPR